MKGSPMIRKTFILVVLAFFVYSCSSKEVKQPTPESKTSLEAFALAETIKGAFIKNDMAAIRNNSTEAGYKDVTLNKTPFDSVELTFTPRWVEIEDNKVTLNVAWKSQWGASGKTISDRGMAIFVLEDRPLKLAKILRSNPFIFPEK